MDNMFYTDERNTQILISILKANNIKYVVTSPGTTHMCFVGSVQHDSFFKVYSCVDERSAAYMACGMAEESGEPVVITCTGATASRNYYPALTEAYYRKLPVIAITAHQGTDRLGHLLEQNIDRRRIPYDIAKLSVEAVYVKDERDEHYCAIEVNRAILECKRHGGGPVHINFFTRYSTNFSIKELPSVQIIKRYTAFDAFPKMPKGRIGVFVGAHKSFSKKETQAIDSFCATNNAVVFCDHTSGYNGAYKVLFALCLSQQFATFDFADIDLLIHIGEVSGDATSRKLNCKEVWRVSEDGEIRDSFGKLSSVFEMPEHYFFEQYSQDKTSEHSYHDACVALYNAVFQEIPDLPLSTIWIARELSSSLPEGCSFHLGIWSSLRALNYFKVPESTKGSCNVGGFGIDGCISTMIGASLCNPKKLHLAMVGDLAFFYDMNVLGNKHVGNNVRIIVINNGQGNEMRYSFSPASSFGKDGKLYLAAAGHFGKQSKSLVKYYAESLGYEYFSALTKEEFLKYKGHILSEEHFDKPMVFEVFITDEKYEEEAYQLITSLDKDKAIMLKNNLKSAVKSVIGKKGFDVIKSILKK